MLSPVEAKKVFDDLSTIAVQSGLKWLVSDVEREISLGRELVKKIQVESSDRSVDGDFLSKRRGRHAAFVVSEPYDARERLELLVGALEATSVGLSLSVIETYEFIASDLEQFSGLEFAEDAEGTEPKRIGNDFLKRKEAIVKLQMLLRELREVI